MKFLVMFIHVLLIDLVLQCIGYDTKTWEYWVITFLACSTYISGYAAGKQRGQKVTNVKKEERVQ